MTANLGILLGYSGAASVTAPGTVEYLVVAGGGAGAQSRAGSYSGAGGGAGGMLTNVSFIVDTITPYTVTVGAGGASNSSGNNSVFASITSTGGGAGGGAGGGSSAGFAGGSGGGGTGGVGSRRSGGAGIVGQGSAGGRGGPTATANMGAGGGGGAGGAGGDGIDVPNGGAGGIGLESSITGISTYYAGGGGGSSSGAGGLGGGGTAAAAFNATPTGGSPNTGGGGGAGSRNGGIGSIYYAGSLGGSGVVVIAYPTIYDPLQYIDSGLVYTVNTTDRLDYRVYRFTQGTGSIRWGTGSTVPGQVLGVTAVTYGSGLATITFNSAYNGGSVITSYTVISNPGNITVTGAASPITVSGLTDGIAYTFTVYATNAIGNGQSSLVSNSITSGDVNFSSVSLLLKTSPTDGINNNDFIDYSGNFFPVRVGTPIGTYFNPYGLAAGGASASGYFNGSTDYLRIDDNQVLQPESGDFTYEAWIYPLTAASGSNYKFIWGHRSGAGNFGGAMIGFNSSLTLLYFIANAAATTWQRNAVSTGLSVTLNTWQHIALTRSGNTVTCYRNGGAGTPVTVATGAIGTTGNFVLMAGIQTGGQNIDGYMTDFRLVKGRAIVPPSGGPTTPLTAVVNTVILIKIDPGIYDASPRSLTAGSRVFTLGTSQSTNDTSVWSPTSMVFSGGGANYLTIPLTTDLQFSTGDFTVECWTYLVSRVKTTPCIFANYTSYTTGALGLFAGHNSATTTQYQVAINGGSFPTTAVQSGTSGAIIYNAWAHLAVVRSSGVISLYLNGVRVGNQITSSVALNGNGTNFSVGSINGDANSFIDGYIQDFRVTNGLARYTTANFSTPSGAFAIAAAPVGIPKPPTIISAVAATPTSAMVQFIQPDSDNGSAITSYTAVSSPGGFTGTVSQATSGAVTVTGLAQNTAYTFKVYATNAYGNSPSSSASNSITTQTAATPFFSYLVVAGGGGGGGGNGGGGGGGAGGLLTGNVTYTAGVRYDVSVGGGGSGHVYSPRVAATSGTNSSISGTGLTTITAIGGGRGGALNGSIAPETGGSGGGGGVSTTTTVPTAYSLGAAGTSGQGNSGGNGTASTGNPNIGPGGGGGAGAPGSSNTTPHRGGEPGGIGVVSYLVSSAISLSRAVGQDINGFIYFAGGGGGGGYCGSTINPILGGLGGGGQGAEGLAGTAGTAHTGGGGGGGADACGSVGKNGAAGGSGVVVISSPYTATATTGSVYVDTTGNLKIYTFIGPGSITF